MRAAILHGPPTPQGYYIPPIDGARLIAGERVEAIAADSIEQDKARYALQGRQVIPLGSVDKHGATLLSTTL